MIAAAAAQPGVVGALLRDALIIGTIPALVWWARRRRARTE